MSELVRVDELPLGEGVRVLEHNEDGLVALEKPAGLMVHPNKPEERKFSMLYAHYHYEKECFHWEVDGVSKRVWLINRIDSPTSGVVLVALDEALAKEIKQQFATHRVNKVYHAIVKRVPSNHTGTWSDMLTKEVYRAGRKIPGAAHSSQGDLPVGQESDRWISGLLVEVDASDRAHPSIAYSMPAASSSDRGGS